ncbi:MAG: ribosome biogenesis GTP-binding protein YihA/YsxC [Lachnospiraceae bacterium]|nr:ribosome biogenesis GTP-binding protein YihA/YsxC [Lachnospiraceae bacterium]
MLTVKTAELYKVTGDGNALKQHDRPEIVFAGKSNVGKSSLINSLLNRKSLARTSQTPGKTRTVNYYLVNGSFFFVDLPGYGYASVGRKDKSLLGKIADEYLKTTDRICLILLLMDSRHTPGKNDIQMYEWVCSNGYEPCVIATKSDKLNRSEFERSKKEFIKTMGMKPENLIMYSSLTGDGRDETLGLIDRSLKG